MAVRVGTSGWSYEHWQGVLYPQGAPRRARLDYYAARFRTVEVNSTYYRWPKDATFASWRRRTPEDFLLTVKAPGLLTHVSRLFKPERWVERATRAMNRLGEKRGVLLVQLSPAFPYDHPRLAYFLDCFPRGSRLAFEFRHPSWHREETFRLLERHGAAYCVMSGAHLPCVLRATAPFVYVRMHGPSRDFLYAGSYSREDLAWWAERVGEWESAGLDVLVYFNNDGEGHAVRNALALQELLGR